MSEQTVQTEQIHQTEQTLNTTLSKILNIQWCWTSEQSVQNVDNQ